MGVAPETEATEALRLMAEHTINQLPVIAGSALQGLLTRAALIQAIQFHTQTSAGS